MTASSSPLAADERPSPSRRSIGFAWLLAGAMGALVWIAGGTGFSASDTSRILGPLIRFLLPDLSPEQHAAALFWTRKCAHVVEYGLFACLTLRALLMSSTRSLAACLGASLVAALLLAAADESRQGTLAARSGSAADVALDLFGAGLFLGLLMVGQRWLDRSLVQRPSGLASYWRRLPRGSATRAR